MRKPVFADQALGRGEVFGFDSANLNLTRRDINQQARAQLFGFTGADEPAPHLHGKDRLEFDERQPGNSDLAGDFRENRQNLFGTGFRVITFGKPAGIEEVAVQLPVLTLGDESLRERVGDLRQSALDFFKRGNLPQRGGGGANFVKKLPSESTAAWIKYFFGIIESASSCRKWAAHFSPESNLQPTSPVRDNNLPPPQSALYSTSCQTHPYQVLFLLSRFSS